MATRDLTREEAAALYAQKLLESHPDEDLKDRIAEYQKDVEERLSRD